MVCQRFKESVREKTISFQIDNTTAVSTLLKEGGTHCKTLNDLVGKILLKCHKNRVMMCLEYLRGVAHLQADALTRVKRAQEWSLGDPANHRYSNTWVLQ